MLSASAHPIHVMSTHEVTRWSTRWRALVLCAALLFLMPQTALAHLGLRRSTPAHGAHLAKAPREIRLTFTEAVEASVARLRLIGPSGAAVPISTLRQPGDSAQVLVTDVLGRLVGGVYRLEWQVIGKDGHPVRGTISYVVAPGATGLADPRVASAEPTRAAAGTPATRDTTHDSSTAHHDPTAMPSGAYFSSGSPGYAVVRALQFAALLAVLGSLAFALVVLALLRPTAADVSIVTAMRRRAALLGWWAGIALLGMTLMRLYAQSLAMHGPGEALDALYVAAMLAKTVWGWGWLLQLVGTIAAIIGFRLARRGQSGGWSIAAIAGLALAVTPALSGHAASTPALTTQAVIADTLHVIGAAGWLGSLLFVLVVGIPVALQMGGERRGDLVARLVGAFSPTALGFAGLAALTGVFAAWLHIGVSSALWTSDYGRTLLVKLAVLSVVLGTGAYNWLRVRPALGDDTGTTRLKRSATIELAVGVLVVIVTAVLVGTPPPMEMDGGANTSVQAAATGN